MKTVIYGFFLLLAIGLVSVDAGSQSTARIKFKRGSISSTVVGSLKGFDDSKTYVIEVRAGQTLSTQQTGTNNITLSIKDPNGDDVTDADASCNNRKSISPTIAGDYTITVVQCQKADEWNGAFKFRVTVR